MDNATFIGIYNEFCNFRESTEDDYGEILLAYHKWEKAQKDTNDAYDFAKAFTDGDAFMDAQKTDGYAMAKKYMDNAWINYKACKARRDDYKQAFLDKLDTLPDFTSSKARELGELKLAEYLEYLEKKGIRKDTYGREYKDGQPHINSKVSVDVKSYKVSKPYGVGDNVGVYVTATGKDGLLYNLFLKQNSDNYKELMDKINNIVCGVEGIVVDISDYYGQDQIKLKNAKVLFEEKRVEEDQLNDILENLKKKYTVTDIEKQSYNDFISAQKNLPEYARLYAYSYSREGSEYSWCYTGKYIYKLSDTEYVYLHYCEWDSLD